MPVFSVIVPVYKVEAYLEECIESILAQTFSDYELILVDDGSPDRCGEICDTFAQRDSRIHVIHKENGGLSDARNAGLDIAAGDYICFVDSDDCIVPDMLETLFLASKNGADMIAYRMKRFYPDGRIDIREMEYGEYCMNTGEARLVFLRDVLVPGKISWDAGSRIYAREKIEKYGLRFADNRKIFAEDLFFCFCFCAHAKKVLAIDKVLYNYRMRNDSIMGTALDHHNVDRLALLCKEACRYLERFDDCCLLVQNMYTFCYQIIASEFMFHLWRTALNPVEFRNQVVQSVTEWDFLKEYIRKQLRNPFELRRTYSGVKCAEMAANMQFLMDGSWNLLRVKLKLIQWLHPVLEKIGIKNKVL